MAFHLWEVMLKCEITAQLQRNTDIFNNIHKEQKLDALNRVVTLIEVRIQSPHITFGIIV